MKADPKAVALYLGEFFAELMRCGVRNVVVSPGSRSTPLAMAAFELSQRFPDRLHVTVDVDERGAAFLALGVGKATGVPAAVVCTSGTAVANWYPAVLESESSRVPLLLLSGDRPPQLQGLGAPQTCDQLHAFGTHVRAFRQMLVPSDDAQALAFARQSALEAVFQAQGEAAVPKRIAGACNGGPVHLNFPFDEPLKPDFSVWDGDGAVQQAASVPADAASPVVWSRSALDSAEACQLARLLAQAQRPLVLAGEGTCATDEEAAAILNWAHSFGLPLLADPLSGLRRFGDLAIVDGYDSIIGPGGTVPEDLRPTLVVRFGRYPVSKKATQLVAGADVLSIVVDRRETRDFNAATDQLVACDPADFAQALTKVRETVAPEPPACEAFLQAWQQANKRAVAARDAIADAHDCCQLEGAYVRAALELVPDRSLVFAANSMSIRALDTFYPRGRKLAVLCNRGLNGIDGTLSTAIGAALGRENGRGEPDSSTGRAPAVPTVFITGDLTLQHDLNALALQRELLRDEPNAVSVTVVLLNNNGGAIFDMLPSLPKSPTSSGCSSRPRTWTSKLPSRPSRSPHGRWKRLRALRLPTARLLPCPVCRWSR